MRQLSSGRSARGLRRWWLRRWLPRRWWLRPWWLRPLAAAGLCLACSAEGDGGNVDAELAESTAAGAALSPIAEAPAARCELPSAGYAGECNECLAARCCEPIEACKGDAGCAQQLTCEVQCQYDAEPSACTAQCFAAGPHPLYEPYDDCSFGDCRASCWS